MESSSRHSHKDDESRDSSRRRHRSRSKSRSRSRSRSRERDRSHHHHKKHRTSSPSSSSSRKESRDKDRDRHRSSHKSDRDRDRDRSHRHDKDRDQRRERHKEKKRSSKDKEDEGGEDDDSMWVEKEVSVAVTSTVTTATATTTSAVLPASGASEQDASSAPESSSKRAAWMLDDGGGLDFAMMGVEKPKKPKEEKPDPEKLQVSSRELNVYLKAGMSVDQYPEQEKKSYTIGDAGSNWRMTKLRRVLETAAEEGVAPEVIGIERYGSLEKFNEAMEERRELDRRKAERDGRRNDRSREDRGDRESKRGRNDDRDRDRDRDRRDRDRDSGRDSPMSTSGRYSTYSSAASSPFHRPMEPHERQERELARRAMEKDRERKTSTPIPSPFATIVSTPIIQSPNPAAAATAEPSPPSSSATAPTPALSQDKLNKLKAKALRAKLMGTPDADKLEKEYEAAEKAFKEAAANPSPRPPQQQQPASQAQDSRVVVVNTLQHTSSGSASPAHGQAPVKKRAYGKGKEITHDAEGNRIAYEGEEGDVDLHDLVLRERLDKDSGGMDREYARRITRDARFQDDVDYLDENVDKIARTVKRTDKQLKDAAVNDYKRTQNALDSCQLCFKDDGQTAPITPVVSLGTRVYLGLPLVKEFLPGQCLIVPLQHVTSTLELDDDAWDEIRNFMKCLIQMHAAKDRFVVFSETVIHLGRYQKHTAIECYPIPWQAGQAASGYFKEAILSVAEEWSQHKKIIETNAKDPQNGGIRRRLTSKLPYFHVWCFGNPDRGYGHVIEDDETKFPDYFVREVLASVCEMDSWEWQRKPKRLPVQDNDRRVQEFKRSWQPWDWTRTLEKQ
ncbi:hypothetical protein BGW41_002509 [Actinomortierella wolfii]|nr:hypothetical protein BGW41_002509 [Actinomortierella wolfii]